jgi:hypothetical protein
MLASYSKLLPDQFQNDGHKVVCAYSLSVCLKLNSETVTESRTHYHFMLRFSLLKITAEVIE